MLFSDFVHTQNLSAWHLDQFWDFTFDLVQVQVVVVSNVWWWDFHHIVRYHFTLNKSRQGTLRSTIKTWSDWLASLLSPQHLNMFSVWFKLSFNFNYVKKKKYVLAKEWLLFQIEQLNWLSGCPAECALTKHILDNDLELTESPHNSVQFHVASA